MNTSININNNFVSSKNKKTTIIYPLANIKGLLGTSSFIFAKFTNETITKSKKAKKNKRHYVEVSINGLHQPTNKTPFKAYQVLNILSKRFKVDSLDIAMDTSSDKSITNISKHFTNTKRYKNTVYQNNIKTYNKITTIKIYNKGIKENTNNDWIRAEAILSIQDKLKHINSLHKEVDYMYILNHQISNHTRHTNDDMINVQLQGIKDFRTLSRSKKKYKELLNLHTQNPLKKTIQNSNKKPTKTAFIKHLVNTTLAYSTKGAKSMLNKWLSIGRALSFLSHNTIINQIYRYIKQDYFK